MRTLIYVGANDGNGLEILLREWQGEPLDRVYAFEPDPEMYEKLCQRFDRFRNNIHLINAACTSTDGVGKFYITPNRVSSSLGDINMTNQASVPGGHSGGELAFKVIEVQTINLYNFCQTNNITEIEYLQTDCQGSDLAILKTMKLFFDEKKIKGMCCETHRDDFEIYIGLHNSFSQFKELLQERYEVLYYRSLKGKIIDKDDLEELSNHHEWDTYWKLK